MVGDFNLADTTWPDGTSTNNLETKFINTFDDFNFSQVINSPTHEGGRTLDIVLTNLLSLVNNIKILEKHQVCKSDHFGITFTLSQNVNRIKPIKRKVYNYTKANWAQLKNDLMHVNWKHTFKSHNARIAWNIFKSILSNLCDKNYPKITIQDHFQPPWYESDVHKTCKKKERLRAKFKRTNDPGDYQKFKECRKNFKKTLQEKMKSNFNDNSDPALISKRFWNHVKVTSNSTRIPECVSYGNRFRTVNKDQAELFNSYFYDQFSSPSSYEIPIDYTNDKFSIFSNFEISQPTIINFLNKIDTNKSPGPDGIHGKVLKNCAQSIAYPLYLIFNESFHSGYIPSEWKLGNVVPVFKKGDKSLVENYSPISLTSLIMKTFEKCIRKELMVVCNHLIDNSQHGFLPKNHV